jgi:peptide/nickel transport system substrate-binding protein
MKNKKSIALILLVLMVISSLTACGGKETPTTPNQNGDSTTGVNTKPVVIYAQDIFTSLDPYQTISIPDNQVFRQVYETLCYVDEDGTPKPYLAESWDISDDGLTYTFKLAQNAFFSDGTQVKASDVAFSYDYAKQYPSKASAYQMVETVEVIDDFTIKFNLNARSPLFLAFTQNMPIISEAFVKANNGDISSVACGSGPYTVVEYNTAVKCVLAAREDYRNGAPAIKNAEIRYFAEASSAQVAFEAGEVTFMSMPTSSAKLFIDNPDYNSERLPMFHTAIIALNTTKAPFDNKLVRQAFSYAMDKDSIIEIAYDGYATKARLQAYTTCFGVDFSKAENIDYNPEKAKQLLAEAGYPNGMNLTDMGVHMDVIAGGYHEKIAQVYQQNLKDIGVEIELVATETPDENAKKGDFVIMNEGISFKTDFSGNTNQYCTSGIGGLNWSQMSDPYVDEMFEKGNNETDPEKRKEIYRDLIAYLIDYCPSIPVFHKQSIFVWDKNLNANVYPDSNTPFYLPEWSWNN